jgi:hypothetical protein
VCVCVLHVMVFSIPAFSQSCGSGPCSVSPDYTVGSNVSANATYHSTSGVPGNITDATILVCGDFIIDQNFNAFTSTFVLTEDSRLIVEKDIYVIQVECTYYGCDGMWKGILVETGGIFYIDQSFVYDAYVAAVKAEPGTAVILNQTTFDRNHISFWVEGPGTRVGCDKNTFYANNFNFNFPGGDQGENDGKPWIAIDVYDQSLLIGGGGTLINHTRYNEFNGPFDFGIRTNQSVVQLENNIFKNLAHQRGSKWEGTAIIGQNQSTHIILSNTFENIFRGVDSRDFNSGFSVEGNNFKEYNNAILGAFVITPRGIVKDNEIGTSDISGNFGVFMGQFGSRLQTTDNTIFVDSRDGPAPLDGGIGIFHSGSFGISSLIEDNDITLYFGSNAQNFRHGINVGGQRGTEILNNNIEIESNGEPFFGFESRNSEELRIEENSIAADQQGTNVGIRINDSPDANFCCNIVTLMDIGVWIRGICDASNFASNDLFDSNLGLIIDNGSILGRQELTGNRWRGIFDELGAGHVDNRDFVIQRSKFIVPNLTQPEGPGTVFPNMDWFDEDNTIEDNPCGTETCEEGNGPGLTDLDTLFAGGAMDTIFGDGSSWTHSQTLFSKMKKNPSLYGVYDVTDDWYDDQIGNIVEDYYLVHDTINRLFQLTSQQQDTVDRAMDTIEVYFTELRYIDSLIFSDTITQWHQYDSSHSEIVGKIDSVYGIYLNTLETTINTRITRAQNLLNTNDQLSTPDLPARYEKMYNDILLETVASNVDTFTLAQKDSLYIMASACPEKAGRTVYWAGTLYQLIEDTHFNIQDQCDTTSSRVLNTPNISESISSLLVIPNPAEDYIELTGLESEALDGIETVKIYNISGVEIWSGSLGLSRRIAIGHVAPGIYTVLLVTDNHKVYRSKFIVQR